MCWRTKAANSSDRSKLRPQAPRGESEALRGAFDLRIGPLSRGDAGSLRYIMARYCARAGRAAAGSGAANVRKPHDLGRGGRLDRGNGLGDGAIQIADLERLLQDREGVPDIVERLGVATHQQ